MLKDRLIFGSLLIAVVVGLLWADTQVAHRAAAGQLPWLSRVGLARCDGLLIAIVVAAVVVLGTREMHHLFVAAGHQPVPIWPAPVNVALVLIPFMAANASPAAAAIRDSVDFASTVTWLTVTFLGTAFLVARRGRISGSLGDIAATLLIVFYLGLLPQYIIRMRLVHPDGGAWLLLYFLATVKFCDIGAFFVGRSLGRHKLIEWLSPHKTIEGLCGGVVASAAVAVILPMAVRGWVPTSAVATLLPRPGTAVVFGVLMALVGQGGDLFESLIKREAHAKDSANAIPAFGGVLDVLDSPLLAAPIGYWMLLP